MKLIASVVFAITLSATGQVTPGKLSFALPDHPGAVTLDQGEWKIVELSAKPNTREFGIRAAKGDERFLGFLFLWPEKAPLTSETCRDEMLLAEKVSVSSEDKRTMRSKSGADIALALLVPDQSHPHPGIRAFIAKGDLCADITLTYPSANSIPESKQLLETLTFNSDAAPSFRDAFAYATVEWDKQQMKGAASAYAAALKLVDSSDDPTTWRRVTTDQLSMALGISGDLDQSRAVNVAAIAKDPTYPLYYFNLACADAEENKLDAAKQHLQQAWDRRQNTLKGEKFPDPAKDDSILKLKSNAAFWTFVEGLH
jgi:tetratricopeptide (TPR) repeat protein